MRNRRAISIGLLALAMATSPAFANEAEEATLDILLATIEANKKALVAVNLPLEDAEAAEFWPLYDRYDAELSAIRSQVANVVAEYTEHFSTMSDERAEKLLETFLALERQRAEVREKYLDQFEDVIPGRKLVRFYQIENKMHALLRYELARQIPVIEE